MLEDISYIKDKSYYVDENIKNTLCKDYNHILSYYLQIRKAYLNVHEKNNSIISVDEDEKTYIYASPSVINDLKDIPIEYLDVVDDLLKRFKNNQISLKEKGGFKSNRNYKGFEKLIAWKIRIVFKRYPNNIICIMGMKKDQQGTLLYDRICSRKLPQNIADALKEAPEIERNMESYIKDFKRQEKTR